MNLINISNNEREFVDEVFAGSRSILELYEKFGAKTKLIIALHKAESEGNINENDKNQSS